MTLKFQVPPDPRDNGRWWIKDYTNKSNVLATKAPFYKTPFTSFGSRFIYWTLDPKLHNFFKHHNIDYTLDYITDPYTWSILIEEKDRLRFKLCWISAEDVYHNF